MSEMPDPISPILEDPMDEEAKRVQRSAAYLMGTFLVVGIAGKIPIDLFGHEFSIEDIPSYLRVPVFGLVSAYVAWELWGSISRSIRRWRQRWENAYDAFRLYLVRVNHELRQGVEAQLGGIRQEEETRIRSEVNKEKERWDLQAAEQQSRRQSLSARVDEIQALLATSTSTGDAASLPTRALGTSTDAIAAAALQKELEESRKQIDAIDAMMNEIGDHRLKIAERLASASREAASLAQAKFDEVFAKELQQAYQSSATASSGPASAPNASTFSRPEAETLKVAYQRNQRFTELRDAYGRRRWQLWLPYVFTVVTLCIGVALAAGANGKDDDETPAPTMQQVVSKLGDDMNRQSDLWRDAFSALGGGASEARVCEKNNEQENLENAAYLLHGPDGRGLMTIALPFFAEGKSDWSGDLRNSLEDQVRFIADAWADCGTFERKLWIHVFGFADPKCFHGEAPGECNSASDTENIQLANGRASSVARAIRSRVDNDRVLVTENKWPEELWGNDLMLYESGFARNLSGRRYTSKRGQFSRRVEVRILDGGVCSEEVVRTKLRTVVTPLVRTASATQR